MTRVDSSKFVLSMTSGDNQIEVEEDVNQDYNTYKIYRVDKKVVSLYFFGATTTETETGLDWDKSLITVVLSTSGERLHLSDIVINEEDFLDYLNQNDVVLNVESIDDLDWFFTHNGIFICLDGLDEYIQIPYVDFDGIMNTNYIPTEGPIYGESIQIQPGIIVNNHSISYDRDNSGFSLCVDGDKILYFENEEGESLIPHYSKFFLRTNDDRYFIWIYDYDYSTQYDENGNGIGVNPINYCAMLVEITNGYPEVVATIHEGPEEYYSIYDIPEDILELMGYSEW